MDSFYPSTNHVCSKCENCVSCHGMPRGWTYRDEYKLCPLCTAQMWDEFINGKPKMPRRSAFRTHRKSKRI